MAAAYSPSLCHPMVLSVRVVQKQWPAQQSGFSYSWLVVQFFTSYHLSRARNKYMYVVRSSWLVTSLWISFIIPSVTWWLADSLDCPHWMKKLYSQHHRKASSEFVPLYFFQHTYHMWIVWSTRAWTDITDRGFGKGHIVHGISGHSLYIMFFLMVVLSICHIFMGWMVAMGMIPVLVTCKHQEY